MGMVIVFAFFAYFGYDRNFLSPFGVSSWVNMASTVGMIAIPIGFLMIAGELDISIGAVVPAAKMSMAIAVGYYGLPVGVGLLMLLAGPRGGSVTLILAGVAISALAGAGTALVLNLSPNPYAANEIVFWLMGSLADRSMVHVMLALPLMVVGAVLIARSARALDALTLGEAAAAALGVSPGRLRIWLVCGVALIVGPATAVAGAVGFVGLVVPHVLRPLVGARPSVLLPASALGGAVLLLAADIAVRLILPERDLKLGVLTAIVGAPLFLHLIWKTRSGGRV